jgi:hypothetical protein
VRRKKGRGEKRNEKKKEREKRKKYKIEKMSQSEISEDK